MYLSPAPCPFNGQWFNWTRCGGRDTWPLGLHVHHIGQRGVWLPDALSPEKSEGPGKMRGISSGPFWLIHLTTAHLYCRVRRLRSHALHQSVVQRVFDIVQADPRARAAYHVGAVNPYLLVGQVLLRHRCEPAGQLRCAVRRSGELVRPRKFGLLCLPSRPD